MDRRFSIVALAAVFLLGGCGCYLDKGDSNSISDYWNGCYMGKKTDKKSDKKLDKKVETDKKVESKDEKKDDKKADK